MASNSNTNSMRLIIVTGLSGSGKSVAIRQLEDSGYYCLDNLPSDFLVSVINHLRARGFSRVAVALDARGHSSFTSTLDQLKTLQSTGVDVRSLFLTASNSELIKRFSETRRRHPLSLKSASGEIERTLHEAIRLEREILTNAAEHSHVLDTTGMHPNVLRDCVKQFADAEQHMMTLAFESFAFKHGTPVAADFVFDVRNLPNPFWVEELRPFNGTQKPIIDFLDSQPEVRDMVNDLASFIKKWLPSYEAQNRHYLTIAVGCTGGQHRSVYVAEAIAREFKEDFGVVVRHRQLLKKASQG